MTYVEHHRTLGDWVELLAGAGFALTRLLEPEWPEGHDRVWGGWSEIRGRLTPGTAIVGADLLLPRLTRLRRVDEEEIRQVGGARATALVVRRAPGAGAPAGRSARRRAGPSTSAAAAAATPRCSATSAGR